MRCPYCENEESKVLDSRPVEDGMAIRRRRECLNCARRFTTYERVDHVPLMVAKRDGRREPFSRDKVLAGLVKATGKRPVSMEDLEAIVEDITREVRNRAEREIPSREVGEMVMERLRRLDEVAYVRFASEHHRFEDVDTIAEEIATLKARKAREEARRAQVPLIPLVNGTTESK